jgi:hypothetical protein
MRSQLSNCKPAIALRSSRSEEEGNVGSEGNHCSVERGVGICFLLLWFPGSVRLS